MTDPLEAHVTDIELSGYLDTELEAPARGRVAAHLATCPHCAKRLAAFDALSADFARLPTERLGFDLAAVLAAQLPTAPQPAPRRRWPLRGWRGLLPVGLGASASVVLGVALGAVLFGGGAALPGVTAMRVFDPMPPGGLCHGPDGCYATAPHKTGAIK